MRTRAQRNNHCRTSSLNKYNYYRLKPTGRLDQIVLHKTIGHKGSPQYRLNKSKNRLKSDPPSWPQQSTFTPPNTQQHGYFNSCPASDSKTSKHAGAAGAPSLSDLRLGMLATAGRVT